MSSVRSIGWVSTAVSSVLAVVGCRQIVGVEDREPPIDCAAAPEGSAACADCVREACCAEAVACEEESTCASRARCWASCAPGDFACARDCASETPATEAWAAFRSCSAGRCSTACGIECGGTVAPLPGCSSCADACCAAGAACAGDLECQRLDVCRDACDDGDLLCREVCVNEHPGGASLERAISDCTLESCHITEDWSCVGNATWPVGEHDEITLTLEAIMGIDLAPAEGATLTACYAVLPDCLDPADGPVTLDATGRAELVVPVNTIDHGYTGFLQLVSDDILPALYFYYPPITENVTTGIHAYRAGELAQLAALSDHVLLPGYGHLLVSVADCRAGESTATSITVQPADEELAIVDLSADGESGGFFWVFNVPPGVVEITASIEPLCTDVGTVPVIVREGFLTNVTVPPTP